MKLFKVTVSRDYHFYKEIDITAKDEREARIEANRLLRTNEVELQMGHAIKDTDNVDRVTDKVCTRCPNCDSAVKIDYAPNSEVKCPACDKVGKTNNSGNFVWSNWR